MLVYPFFFPELCGLGRGVRGGFLVAYCERRDGD